MTEKEKWFERKFPQGLPLKLLPSILERLRGTPARLEERLERIGASVLTRKMEGKWSIQENAGHMLDLEPLWTARATDLLSGRGELTPADLTNRRTDEAGFNTRELSAILRDFREKRAHLLSLLESADNAVLGNTALHPRLRTPMTIVDLAHFVAEHDDHHLAGITELLRDARHQGLIEDQPSPKQQEMIALDTSAMPWEERYQAALGKSNFRKLLLQDPDTGMEIRLLRYPAGFTTTWHTHPCAHGMYVLEGTLVTHAGRYGPGSFVWFPEGMLMEHGAQAHADVVMLFITNKKFAIHFVEKT